MPRLAVALLAVQALAASLGPGNILTATARSHDPDFAASVIVLIQFNSEFAVGLMLNKPTTVPVGDVLPEAKGKKITVYAGGPIIIGVRGLLRTKSAPYFSVMTSRDGLVKLISSGTPPDTFRLYAGYVGWTAKQLENEVARGLWTVSPPTPVTLFGP